MVVKVVVSERRGDDGGGWTCPEVVSSVGFGGGSKEESFSFELLRCVL